MLILRKANQNFQRGNMKQVSQGGTELIIFKRQKKGDWVGGLLLEPPSRPEAQRPIVLEMESQMLPARKDPTPRSVVRRLEG